MNPQATEHLLREYAFHMHKQGCATYRYARSWWLGRVIQRKYYERCPCCVVFGSDAGISYFLQVEEITGGLWTENTRRLAKAHLAKGDKENAMKCLVQAGSIEPANEADCKVLAKVKKLMRKYK